MQNFFLKNWYVKFTQQGSEYIAGFKVHSRVQSTQQYTAGFRVRREHNDGCTANSISGYPSHNQHTVVFMMPVPWVRMELAMCRMLMVFKCLLLEERSTKICSEEAITIQQGHFIQPILPLLSSPPPPLPPHYLVIEVVTVTCHKDMDVSHDLQDIQTLRDSGNILHRRFRGYPNCSIFISIGQVLSTYI